MTMILTKIYAQTPTTPKKYSQTELNQDLDSLKSYIIQTHPNPFSVMSKADFDKKIAEIKTKFNKDLTLKEYYKLVAPLVSSIADGHTALRFAGSKFMDDESYLFPYTVKMSYSNPQIVVNEYVYDTLAVIPSGAEILSINEIASKQIIEKIAENTSGESREYRIKIASNVFLGAYLFTFFDFGDNFKVKFKVDNKIIEKQIPAIKYAALKKAAQSKKKPAESKKTPNYSLILKNDSKTAIIDFRYFDDENAFKIFLDSSFNIIKKEKITNLIIDIRENGGGNSALGDQLLQYVSKSKFTQFGRTIVKYSQIQKNFFKANCEADSTNCETYNYLKKQQNGKIETFDDQKLITPNSNIFNGKIYLLTRLKTFSSASNFAQCFKHYKIGTVVGEETGGWIVAYGDKIATTLPISKLAITISQKKFYTVGATENDLHGIIPDVKVKSENALDFVLKKIKSEK